MSTDDDGDDDFKTDLFAGVSYEASSPRKKEFCPWHRPRKQFVRYAQWGKEIDDLLRDLAPSEPLKYLGLPGTDLLDLRYFHRECCAGGQRPLRFLGFNSGAAEGSERIELNVSLTEVRALENVDPRSDVKFDDFRLLSSSDSLAWKAAQELGPFDVVNLDLCDGVAKEVAGEDPTMYSAIQSLLGLQSRRTTPWLLLMTSRIGPKYFEVGALEAMLGRFSENLSTCAAFESECNTQFGERDWKNLSLVGVHAEDYFRLAVMALCKWLLGMLHATPIQVEIRGCQAYQIWPDALYRDMVSIALRCTPLISPPADPSGLGFLKPIRGDECADSAAMPARIRVTLDVDRILRTRPELRTKMVEQQIQLLSEARYDVSGYEDWASGG